MVLEKKALLHIERQEVAKVTSHKFHRKKDGLNMRRAMERKIAVLRYGEESVGRQTCKDERLTALINR